MRNGFGRWAWVVAGLLAGCASEDLPPPTGDEVSSGSDFPLTTTNALSLNALSLNALSLNALSLNALSLNALSLNGNVSGALNNPTTGAAMSEYIKYAARCMLGPNQSITVSYVDANGATRSVTHPGNLGLQPSWATTPLSASDNLWLGACLAAHVNSAGIPVNFSVRGPHPALVASHTERTAFPTREGAFFATYDASAPQPWHFFTCFDDPTVAIQSGRTCSSLSAYDTRCGDFFTLVARCTSNNQQYTVACEGSQADGAAVRCHMNAFYSGQPRDVAITQVITSFTKKK